MLDLYRTPAHSVVVTTLLRGQSYSIAEFLVKGVMPRFLIYAQILVPILNATRHHLAVCGVLCVRPSSTNRLFEHGISQPYFFMGEVGGCALQCDAPAFCSSCSRRWMDCESEHA